MRVNSDTLSGFLLADIRLGMRPRKLAYSQNKIDVVGLLSRE